MSLAEDDLNLLLVEPEPDRNMGLTASLQDCGITSIRPCSDFKAVADFADKEKFDIVVVGDAFPEASTKEAMTFLKGCANLKAVPFVLHTTSKNASFLRDIVASGASAILPFPADKKLVERSINNGLRSQQTKELSKLVMDAEFFNELTKTEIQDLLKVAIPRKYHAGEEIITKGDPADCFYILLKGKVLVIIAKSGNRVIDVPIPSGEPFGEMAILDNSPRSAWVLAADECTVLELGSHIIDDAEFGLRMKLFAKLAFVLTSRIRNMNELVDQRVQEGVEALLGTTIEEIEKLKKKPEPPPPKKEKVEKKEEKKIEEKVTEKAEDEEAEASDEEDGEEEGEEEEVNPFIEPTGFAEKYDDEVTSQEEYDVLVRKINLRTDFVTAKIPKALVDMVVNRMFGYWTGSKLAKVNPHSLWSSRLFATGTPYMKRALHMVVACPWGKKAYRAAYLKLPFSQRVIGLSQVGCTGTFLGTEDEIQNYLDGMCLKKAIKIDMEMPIDRKWNKKDVIEFLTHTDKDVRDSTLFLLFDDESGSVTKRFREKFPQHQMITIVKGTNFKPDEPSTLFSKPETDLEVKQVLKSKKEFHGEGFYNGETVLFADISHFYEGLDVLEEYAYIFGTLGIFARVGPDYSGVVWGSSGGAEGAVRAAKALYGLKGPSSSADLASAVSWADGS